jgi:transcriptional regulator with XRE-family HTH domain
MADGDKTLPSKGFRVRVHRAWYDLVGSRPDEGIDQAWLAQEVGRRLGRAPFDQSTVSLWLRGRIPGKGGRETVDILAALAGALEVPAGWLAFGAGEEPLSRQEENGG